MRFSKTYGLSRRDFLGRTAVAAGAAALTFPYVGNVLGANDRINLACIGVGGKGDSDSSDAERCGANIVALCDIEESTLDKKVKQFSGKHKDIKKFSDYRTMLDQVGKSIDAVTISTPDHNHGVAAIRAMKMGKHTFCQKPLVQTVWEAREVRRLARENKLATQMGNQGSAYDGLRRAVEVIQAGIIGTPTELHVWSNRPIWPQGLDRPAGSDVVPASLNWDGFLGPAQERPYKKGAYHTFAWRGWYDFGTGALGDMACHTVNMPFRALKLGYPTVVECEMASRIYPETFPLTSRIRFEFPERDGLPPLKFWWYDGNPRNTGFAPIRPAAELVKEIIGVHDGLPGSGALIVGSKGKLFSADDYGRTFQILMNGQEAYVAGEKHEAAKAVPITIPRNMKPTDQDETYHHMKEWFTMMQENKPSYSNFEIAGYLAEVILLGCVALRVGEGRRMEWDGPNMKSKNIPEAEHFVKRNNRAGWEA